jgi:hypothetical protein
MPNLGEMLAHNIKREKQAAEDSAAALEQMRTEEARRIFNTAKRFFDDARTFFINGITNGEEVAKLFVQVGGARYSGFRGDTHQEFDRVLEGYQYKDEKLGPTSLHDPKRFASLWHEFQQWARENGLIAKWHYAWDGGGMESWWLLKVEPAPASKR